MAIEDEVVPFGEMQAAGNALVAAGFDTYAHVMKGIGPRHCAGRAAGGAGVPAQNLPG